MLVFGRASCEAVGANSRVPASDMSNLSRSSLRRREHRGRFARFQRLRSWAAPSSQLPFCRARWRSRSRGMCSVLCPRRRNTTAAASLFVFCRSACAPKDQDLCGRLLLRVLPVRVEAGAEKGWRRTRQGPPESGRCHRLHKSGGIALMCSNESKHQVCGKAAAIRRSGLVRLTV